MSKQISLSEIEKYLKSHNYSYKTDIKNINEIIYGYSSLGHYKTGTVTWIKNSKYAEGIDSSNVALLIAQTGISVSANNVIYCDESKAAFFGIIDDLLDPEIEHESIGKFTYIANNVKLGNDVVVGSNCVLDGEITIGDRTRIMDGTVIINRCNIGHDTVIQPLCIIGIDGFGYYEDENHHKQMVKHHGGVRIGNHVFIGSHVNIARGTLDDTIIEDDVKVAPSTHIGHNNHIKKSATVICSNVYGSCEIGEDAYITACTIENQRVVGKHSLVGMGSIVTKNVDPDTIVVGIPAKQLRKRGEHDV